MVIVMAEIMVNIVVTMMVDVYDHANGSDSDHGGYRGDDDG